MEDLPDRLSVSSSSSSSSSSSLSTIPSRLESPPLDGELWMLAEERIQEILCIIQPVLVSDRSRNEIIDYVRNLIKVHHGIEVFSFGSVPLKTYLPDGDIDLTVVTHQNEEEQLATQLCCMLEVEGEGWDSDYQVTDVQYIRAQVKVIKCNIRNIAVDISFNQMAGLCALCFLEQIDQCIGRDHLFKRSIILIKAWCYYESRILGANTGLISTYALAVLVLYIINLFHSSLCGPLAVLYKFLDYYGTFDWDSYCVSVSGPVPISSLPQISASPDNNGHELLLDEKFFSNCREWYSVPTKIGEANSHEFPVKHLNIVDPLKHSNNLGRSVTKGNFQRIRHAFSYGARKLRDIITQPGEAMGSRLEKFFASAVDRNGKGQRQDVDEPVTVFGTGRSEPSELSGDYNGYYRSLVYGQHFHGYILPGTSQYGQMPFSPLQGANAGDAVHWFLACQNNEPYQRGLNASTSMQAFPHPSTSMQPFPHPYTSALPPATVGFHNMGRSRGTGPFIPDVSRGSYNDRCRNPSMKKASTSDQTPTWLESSEQTNHRAEASRVGRNNAAGDCCNLSHEASMSCRSIKDESTRAETGNLNQPALRSLQPGNFFSSSGSSMNGADEYSSSMSGRSSPSERPLDPIPSTSVLVTNEKKEGNASSPPEKLGNPISSSSIRRWTSS